MDREREIQAFVPDEYWTFNAMLQDTDKKYSPFKAVYQCKKTGESVGKELADKIEAEVRNARARAVHDLVVAAGRV